MKNSNSKSGGVLVMVMVVMFAFSILAIGLFKLNETDSVEAVYVEQANQAFWLAESGMQRALHKLRTEKSFRDTPVALNEPVGEGTYNVNVTTVSSNRWYIVSTGSVMGVSRVLTLDPLLTAEIGYAIMNLGTQQSHLDKVGTIDGNVYSLGKIDINGVALPNITGEVLATDADNISYSELTSDDRVEMEIDASPFDLSPNSYDLPSYTNIAVVTGGITNTVSFLDLTGNKPVWSNGNLSLQNGTFGDGTLVVTGLLKFPNSGYPFIIHSNATIIVDGDLKAGKEGTFGDNVVVYVTGNMILQKAAGSDTTTFLVEGNLVIKKDLVFNGLIFAEGSVTVDGNLDLTGSLIAGAGFDFKKDYNITYDSSQISQDILDNMIVYVTYAAKPGSWNEVSAY